MAGEGQGELVGKGGGRGAGSVTIAEDGGKRKGKGWVGMEYRVGPGCRRGAGEWQLLGIGGRREGTIRVGKGFQEGGRGAGSDHS